MMGAGAPIDVEAWSTSGDLELSHDQIVVIERSGLAEVIAGSAPETFRVRTGSTIGVLVSEDLELRVSPHLAVSSLMFLLGYAADPTGWRHSVAGFEDEDDLFVAIANAFSWHATWALDRGVLRGYIHRDERDVHLRGRIRFGDQVARSAGLPLPVEISYDDFTEDVLENQMLRTAASLLMRLPRVPQEARKRLARLRSVLAEVSELRVGTDVRVPGITRLNHRYSAALVLAGLVLRGASLRDERGTVDATTFMFDMNRVFEDFVTVALREELEQFGGELRSQVTEVALSQHIRVKPDLAWWRDSGWRAIIDAKYKPLFGESFPNGDAYQMLAYTLAYQLDRGWLIYARTPQQHSLVHTIPTAGKEIAVRALDVRRAPDDLLADVAELAREILASVPTLKAA